MKKHFIAVSLVIASILCSVSCEEPPLRCTDCGRTQNEAQAFLYQHDDGNLYCTQCRDIPFKIVKIG